MGIPDSGVVADQSSLVDRVPSADVRLGDRHGKAVTVLSGGDGSAPEASHRFRSPFFEPHRPALDSLEIVD
jgi:hypothetical protein